MQLLNNQPILYICRPLASAGSTLPSPLPLYCMAITTVSDKPNKLRYLISERLLISSTISAAILNACPAFTGCNLDVKMPKDF